MPSSGAWWAAARKLPPSRVRRRGCVQLYLRGGRNSATTEKCVHLRATARGIARAQGDAGMEWAQSSDVEMSQVRRHDRELASNINEQCGSHHYNCSTGVHSKSSSGSSFIMAYCPPSRPKGTAPFWLAYC